MPRRRSANHFDADSFRRIVLGLDGVTEAEHMGHPDFRLNGRIFATIAPGGARGMVKLPREQQARLVQAHPEIFSLEAGAWGRQGSTRVNFAAADEETVGEAVTLAWQEASRLPPTRSRRRKAR